MCRIGEDFPHYRHPALDLGRTERVLLVLVWAGTVLLLLTPFVITKETIFPFVVGKALYSRTLIEIVFLAWAVLAYRRAEFRPPGSWILILLGAALVVATVSACFGISVQRSFWSTYERMQGVVDQAHWFALALVLVSVVRPAHWRILLGAQVIIGLGIALTAVGQYYGLETLIWDATAKGHLRITTTLGNPIYVGGYALVNCLLAAGLFVQAFPIARTDRGGAEGTKWRGWNWAIATCCASVAVLNAWVVTLAGARGPFLGLLAGVVAVGLLYVVMTRSKRVRLIGLGIAGLFAVAAVLMLASVTIERSGPAQRLDNPLLDRLASFSRSTVDTRIAAWEAGWDGFADAPVLGWGPENFIVVFGRYVDDGVGARMLVHDHAHSKPIEEMATKGTLGLVTYLALWAAILVVLLRTGRHLQRTDRVLFLFAGGALAGQFVQRLSSPDSVDASLLFTLLLAFVTSVAVAAREDGSEPDRPSPWRAWLSSWSERGARVARSGGRLVLLLAAVALAGIGVYTHPAMYSSARAASVAVAAGARERGIDPRWVRENYVQAIEGFGPLANKPRMFMFEFVTYHWQSLRVYAPGEADLLMRMVDAEAREVMRTEPENWELIALLARLHHRAGMTDPEYRATAAHYTDAARRLAPNRREVRRLP